MNNSAPSVNNSHPWYRKPGFVYFIAAGDPPCAIKIGVSARDAFDERLRSIQSANHERIKVLGVIHFKDGDLLSSAKKRHEDAAANEYS